MEEKKNDNKVVWIVGAATLVLILIAFVPGLVEDKQNLDLLKQEEKLLKEGKNISSGDIINEIAEILKNEEGEKLESYLSNSFLYYNDENKESKYVKNFLDDLRIYTSSYDIEKRGNSIKDEETYRVYWNTVEKNVKNGVKRGEHGYCLQTVTIILKKAIKQDIITYEIKEIILKNA